MGELAGIKPENITRQRSGIAKRFSDTSIRLACIALLMAGCTTTARGKSEFITLDLKSAVPSELSEVIQSTNLKSVSGIGGASMAFFVGSPQSYRFNGQGFIVDDGGKLSLHTIAHVAGGEQGYVNIPALGVSGRLEPYHFFYDRGAPLFFTRDSSGAAVTDRAISATLDEASSSALLTVMKDKDILPLTIAKKPVEDLEHVAMPSLQTGRVTILQKRLSGFFSRSLYRNGYQVIKGDSVCAGDSGSPLLRMKGEKITAEVVAVLSSGGSDNEEGCTDQVIGISLAK